MLIDKLSAYKGFEFVYTIHYNITASTVVSVPGSA